MSMVQFLVDVFGHPLFVIVGGVASLMVIFGLLCALYFWFRGVVPVLYRLGMGLSKRKIAIFAGSEFNDLKGLLVESKIFREKNIIQVEGGSLDIAKNINLMLVHYKPFEKNMEDILKLKNHLDALVIYAPKDEGDINKGVLNKINLKRNTIVVNFRGRLLNDILVSMMTTSYK